MTVYFLDNNLILVNNKKVINKKVKSINKGYIINRDLFINEFLGIVKKEKIKIKLLNSRVIVIKNTYFREADIFFIENIMNEIGFLKVDFLDIRNFWEKDNVYVELNTNYMIINFDKGLYFDLDYFKDIPKIITYFKETFNKDIYLYGTNKNIVNIRIKNKLIYYFDNYDTFIVDNILKLEK